MDDEKYEPPFAMTSEISDLLLSVVELVGELKVSDSVAERPWLHRKMRIKTIHSSLAIEGNELDEGQVLAIVDGKEVIGDARDILEVKDAAAAYDLLDELDPLSADDMLEAHGVMMNGLAKDAGRYRMGNVGIYDGDVLLHAGTPSAYVADAMQGLFSWLAETSLHPLVAASVFHYEFEYIHPFSDGNGRMGRLWHTLLLSKWRNQFRWLPIESTILTRQQDYYASLAESDRIGSCEPFVMMMLEIIHDAIDGWIHPKSKREKRLANLVTLVAANPEATYDDLALVLDVSPRTIARDMDELRAAGALRRVGSKKRGTWELKDS